MRHPAPLLSMCLLGLPLAALLLVLGGTPRAFGEDPSTPPAMEGDAAPGMGDAAAPPGKGPDVPDPDDEEDVPDSLRERVGKAVDKGKAWLLKKQSGGNWGPMDVSKAGIYGGGKGTPYNHPSGPTSLALYTLLKCQIPATNNVIKSGFEWLDKRHRRPAGTYETAVLLLAVCATADPAKKTEVSEANKAKIREKLSGPMRKWAQELVDSLLRKHEGRKGWRYQIAEGTSKQSNPGHNGDEDMSSTQLVALGLFAADRCGVTVPTAIWRDILAFSLSQQEESGPEVERTAHLPEAKARKKDPKAPPPPAPVGKVMDQARGFSYMRASPDAKENSVYNSMAACGLAGLMLPRFVLEMKKDVGWRKNGQDVKVQQSVYDAIAWLDLHWSAFENTLHDSWHNVYYMYCLERAMDLVGNKLVGKHIWYVEGAEQLVGRQSEAGFWDTKTTYQPSAHMDTCFALLFLRRSTKGAIPFPDVTGGSEEPPVDRRGKQDTGDGG